MTAILKQFQATPPPAFVKAIEEICFTCGGAHPYYQCLAVDGNTFSEFQDNIQGYVSATAVNYNQEKIKKINEVNIKSMQAQINNVKNELRIKMQTSIQASMSKLTNELKNMMASFFQMNTASTPGSGPLSSKTIANPKGELKAITTRSGLVLDGPSVPMPPLFINPEEDKRVEETLTDRNSLSIPLSITLADALTLILKYQKMLKALLSNKEKLLELANTPLNENCSAVILKKLPEKLGDPGKFLIPYGFSELKCKALTDLGASINLMPLLVWKNLGLPELICTRMTLELASHAICTPAGIARDDFVLVGKFTFLTDFVIVDYEIDPRVLLILGRPFLRTARALIDVHREEMILRDESINMINIYNDSYEDYLEDLFATNHLSGNPTFSSHTNLTSPEVINPLSGNTTSSSPNHFLKEFTDELALIIFPSRNDDLPFDIESDLREIEYLLNHDPTKKMDSILKDLVDECNLADPNNDLVDTIPKMFTDEHTPDYSSPPLYDDVDDDLVEVESDNDDVYDDPFDSKEDKIKESKLLIDEIDPSRSSNFLPSPECNSVLYEDFSEVDALPSTNNEDKVFNPGILIHENLFEVAIRVAPDKNVKKISISNASLILEDFSFPQRSSRSETLLSFSSKNEEKFSTLGFSLLKEFILLFSRNYLIGALKLSKSFKILKARWRDFLALIERTSVFWMFCVSIFIPHEQLNSGDGSSLVALNKRFVGGNPCLLVKNKQETDKIGTKPDQIKKKREAWKSPAMSKTNHS
nr:hypothetical protein [Tanacetum cinerariifolium]